MYKYIHIIYKQTVYIHVATTHTAESVSAYPVHT